MNTNDKIYSTYRTWEGKEILSEFAETREYNNPCACCGMHYDKSRPKYVHGAKNGIRLFLDHTMDNKTVKNGNKEMTITSIKTRNGTHTVVIRHEKEA